MIKAPLQKTSVEQQWSTMRHLKLKCQETGKKSTQSFIYQPHSAMFRKAIIKVTKMNTNDKQPSHEPRTKKDFMILVSQKRLKKQSHIISQVSFYKFSMLNYSAKTKL